MRVDVTEVWAWTEATVAIARINPSMKSRIKVCSCRARAFPPSSMMCPDEYRPFYGSGRGLSVWCRQHFEAGSSMSLQSGAPLGPYEIQAHVAAAEGR